MKKFFKRIRNFIGKYSLKGLVKLKLFKFFPKFVILFPKQKYMAAMQLMKRGYLNVSLEVLKDFKPLEFQEHIVRRILFMQDVIDKGIILQDGKICSIESVNILFAVHNSLPYDKAGYAIRTHSIVTKLHQKGIPLVVSTRPGYPWDIQKHRGLAYKESDKIDGIEYIRLKDEKHTFKKGADSEYIDVYTDELVKQAKIYNSTVIHANSNYLNAHAAVKAANILKIPSIYEIRGLWHLTRLTIDKNYRYNGMFEYEEKMVRSGAEYATKVVVLSEAFKQLLVSWGIEEQKIIVIPNAVDLSLFHPKQASASLIKKYQLQKRFVVGFIGSITAYEGLEYLIQAIESLINEGYVISLMIVGDGNEKKKLEKLTSSKHIIFTGRVPHADVEEYYSIFDICVYPRNNYEVCRYIPPLKPLEAMAMKKAVIVSNVAPLVEMVEDGVNGLVCQADDMESLKSKISILYSDETLRTRLSSNAIQWVAKNRDWTYIADKYIKLYNSFKS